jgi:uncharacterized membrane protein HdeD (DUF308 family)
MSDKHIADILVSGGIGLLVGVLMASMPNKGVAIVFTVLLAIAFFVISWTILRNSEE